MRPGPGDRVLCFPPFELDGHGLWRGKRSCALRPKAAAVLRHLLEHAGAVVTPDELLAALWPGVKVSRGVLKVHVFEIRRALGERRGRAHLETVPGKGYRWIAPFTVRSSRSDPASRDRAPGALQAGPLVGRETELADLERACARARAGDRSIVFVGGEPGIGKTALVDAFLDAVRKTPALRIARGQCIEHHGAGEAYLPVLSALGQLGRNGGRRTLLRVLERCAPTWLVQLPSLLEPAELERARSASAGASRERMLRELAEALERFTARQTLILVLEDLQWSDASTLDSISFLARWPGRMRLLLIGTYRPAELLRSGHHMSAVAHELSLHGSCDEIVLSFLDEADVAAYLLSRLPFEAAIDRASVRGLASAIHRRTEGSPLFMVNVVDDLLGAAGASDARWSWPAAADKVRRSVPPSLRQMIERRLDRLDGDEQSLLEAASVAGAEFSAAALAAALDLSVEEVERLCARLGRSTQLVRPAGTGEWPDGTVAARFGFVHALYQSVLYERLTPARKRAFHRRIGERLERGFGARAGEIAPELANHFEQGGVFEKAARHFEQSAENALRKYANLEAAQHFARAIELVRTFPDTPERARRELALQIRLGAPLLMTRGYSAPEVVAAYSRALELCHQMGESPELLFALVGLYRFALVRLELRTAREIGEQVLRLAPQVGHPVAFLAAHLMLGVAEFGMGNFTAARSELEKGLELYEPAQRPLIVQSFGDDPGVIGLSDLAMALWFLGYPDQALARSREALACAREASIPYSLAFALNYSVWCQLLRGEGRAARADTDALLAVAAESGFQYWAAQGTAMRGWVLIDEGRIEDGVAQIRAGLAAYAAIGAELVRPWHLARLADAYGRMGRLDDAALVLDEALDSMRAKQEGFYEAELYRIQGELLLRRVSERGAGSRAALLTAEEWFQRAIDVARKQSARSLELRAVTSLCRSWKLQGKRTAARERLGEVVAWFSEGFATGDLRAARTLLDQLGAVRARS